MNLYDAKVIEAAKVYLCRKFWKLHPAGQVDKVNRWFPNKFEHRECCRSKGLIPSIVHPHVLRDHCRTAKHVANLFGVDREAILELSSQPEYTFKWLGIKLNPTICERCISQQLKSRLSQIMKSEWVGTLHPPTFREWYNILCKHKFAIPCSYPTESHKPDMYKNYRVELSSTIFDSGSYFYHWVKKPPSICPFLLEHTMTVGNDCNE